MDKVHLRCSKLPLFNLCAGSAIPVRNPIAEPEPEFNNPAKLGTAVHVALAITVDDGEPDLPQLSLAAHVDSDDLAQLYGYGKRCWGMLSDHFGEKPVIEEYHKREFPTFILTGHPDAVSDPAMDIICIMDWKSGRVEYDASWQLFGGSLFNGATRGVIVWLRETWTGNPFEVVEIPPEQEIIDGLTAQVAALGRGECVTGPHCNSMYCPRQHECAAYREYARNGVTALATMDEQLPAIKLVSKHYPAWRAAQVACKNFEGLLNQVLDEHGEVEIGDDKKVVRTKKNIKVYDAAQARKVMKTLGIVDVDSCFKVSGRDFEKVVKAKAKDAGEKLGAAWVGALESLEEAGALHYKPGKSRREMRI